MSGLNQLTASFTETTAATNEIVAAVANRKIVVTNLVLVCASANSVNWENGTTDISGVMSFAANGGYSLSGSRLLETTAGAALQLTQTDASVVAGHLSYRLEQ